MTMNIPINIDYPIDNDAEYYVLKEIRNNNGELYAKEVLRNCGLAQEQGQRVIGSLLHQKRIIFTQDCKLMVNNGGGI